MFQLLIGLIQSRDNNVDAMFSPVRLEVEGYENELMPVFRSCLKSAYADILRPIEQNDCWWNV